MRKLKLECLHAQAIYAAAACAITEVGLTKGMKERDKMVRSIAVGGDGERSQAAAYDAWYTGLLGAVRVEVRVEDCIADFTFTWPELRMHSMAIRSCLCREGNVT